MKRKVSRAKINYFADIIIAISFIVVAVSGMILFFVGSGGYQGGRNPYYAHEILGLSRTLWKDLHDWAGIVMLGSIFLHLVLHVKWIACMTRVIFGGPTKTSAESISKQAKLKDCSVES